MNKKIEKLDPAFMGTNAGSAGASLDEVVLKINEVIDVLNGEQTLEEKSEIPTNLDSLLDDYFEKLVVPEHQIIFEDTFRKIAKDFYEMGRNSKPAEWSEKDNIGWDEAFACVTRAEKAAKNEEELQNAVTAEKWLKEIKFKYCVHPVKEEDEKFVRGLIRGLTAMRDIFGRTTFSSDNLDITETINWLKSLRPSWKPSEIHKTALLMVIRDPNNAGSESCQLALRDLLEQLKKL